MSEQTDLLKQYKNFFIDAATRTIYTDQDESTICMCGLELLGFYESFQLGDTHVWRECAQNNQYSSTST